MFFTVFHPVKLLFSVVVVSLVVLLVFYVWQVNVLIGKTYLRDSLSRRVKELNAISTELSIARSQAEFLGVNSENIAWLSSFEKVGSITYIRMLNGTVVRLNAPQ